MRTLCDHSTSYTVARFEDRRTVYMKSNRGFETKTDEGRHNS